MSKILVALSGGVDSAVAALLLKQQGHEVHAAYFRTWMNEEGLPFPGECPWEDDVRNAQTVADHLGLPFRIIDLVKDYRETVVEYLVDGYRRGLTPNPDIICNREMKFGVFLRRALAEGYDAIATGHYARRRTNADGSFDLLEGLDQNKDQSYFLALLRQDQLAKALFPIGELTKPEVRRLATEAHLPNAARKDSQGICFLGQVPVQDFLERHIPDAPGPIVNAIGKEIDDSVCNHRLDGITIDEHRTILDLDLLILGIEVVELAGWVDDKHQSIPVLGLESGNSRCKQGIACKDGMLLTINDNGQEPISRAWVQQRCG